MVQTDYIQVPYGKAVYGEAEIEAVNKVLRTTTQMGKHVREMEERVAKLYDKDYGELPWRLS
jgi:CDP-4-dehydro-6-deoxyglucose reductase, E1